MEKKQFWRNSSMQMAIIAGLAAAIAAYLVLASGLATGARGTVSGSETKPDNKRQVQNKSQRISGRRTGEAPMLTALRISDYEILKPRIKKGTRINIISGYNDGQGAGLQGITILENVLVVEVPPGSSSRLSSREQGVLIEITKEESERLVAAVSAEPLRIMIIDE